MLHSRVTSLICISLMLFGMSCKKDIPNNNNPVKIIGMLDSIYVYGQQVYHWNTSYPALSIYTEKYPSINEPSTEGLVSALNYLSLRAINPHTQQPWEYNHKNPQIAKYTAITGQDIPQTSENFQSFGVYLSALDDNKIYVRYVKTNSPAQNADLKRGDQILSIEGMPAELLVEKNSFSFLNGKNSIRLSVRSDKQIKELILTKTNSHSSEDITFLGYPDKKTAYLSLLDFPNHFSNIHDIYTQIDNNQGVEKLIIDLRYNGGGFLSGCDEIANMLIPDSDNGKIYRIEKYNEIMQKGKAEILKKKLIVDEQGRALYYINNRIATFYDLNYSIEANTYKFEKTKGFKNLKELYFIVSNQTASASEVLINSLSPYIKTTIIGVNGTITDQTPVRTFGKPMGSIGISIGKYHIYYAMFQNLNVQFQGNYFNGLISDITLFDDITKNFGDQTDPAVSYCLGNRTVQTRNYGNKINFHTKRDFDTEDNKMPFVIKSIKSFPVENWR